MKSYYLETYGCQMNEYDSLIAEKILGDSSFLKVPTPDEADVILLNTCSVRENAHTKIYNRLQSLKHLHKKGTRIGILGCMAQNLGDDLFQKDLPLNFVVGPDSLREIGKAVGAQTKEQRSYTGLSKEETYDDILPPIDLHVGIESIPFSANVAIQRGCDNFCAFCIVPHTRGRERSRPPQSIVDEITALTEAGLHTIVLLGQNVNSYNSGATRFADLVRIILDSTPVRRLYYTSPHPKDFPQELIELTATRERLGSLIHIPLQSGDDEVLANMRREYTAQEFIGLVKKFRDRVPDVAITTDVIAGFPGETREQFQRTLDVMEECRFDDAFMFIYSERQGTSAARFRDDLPEEEKKERLEMMIAAQNSRSYDINQTYIGKTFEVDVRGVSRRSPSDFSGVMRNGKKVVAPLPPQGSVEDYIGKTLRVTIDSASAKTLRGKMMHM